MKSEVRFKRFCLAMVVIALICGVSSKVPIEAQEKEQTNITLAEKKEEQPKPIEAVKEETKIYEFYNGQFECGVEFEPGKYDIIAIKESGNVHCAGNGLNQIMGIEGKNEQCGVEGFFKEEYRNSKFKKGDILELDGIGIKLIKK